MPDVQTAKVADIAGKSRTDGAFGRVMHCGAMTPSIAFVGAGPTTLYTLHALLSEGRIAAQITVFEARAAAGPAAPTVPAGTIRRCCRTSPASRSRRSTETLIDWLQRQPRRRARAPGHRPRRASTSAPSYPRVALGEYFRDQFDALIEQARAARRRRSTSRPAVASSMPRNRPEGMRLTWSSPRRGARPWRVFDHVVLATGHQWPDATGGPARLFPQPLARVRALAASRRREVGIRGSFADRHRRGGRAGGSAWRLSSATRRPAGLRAPHPGPTRST